MPIPEAYFIDIDGTLTNGHNGEQIISYNNIRSMKAAARDGAYIVLSSGRSLKDITEVWKQIYNKDSDKTSYIIANNGALLMNMAKQEIINSKTIDKKTYNKLKDYLYKKGFLFKNSGKKEYFTSNTGFKSYVFRKIINLNEDINNWEYNDLNARKIGVITYAFKWKVAKIAKEIKTLFPNLEVTISGPGLYIEINSKGSTKGKAILEISKLLNINIKNTVHIGDSMNDASAFEVVGVSVAMKNGMKKLKRKADIVTPSIKKDGVSKAIDSLRFS